MATTMLNNLIDAEVMADAISGKIGSKIRVTPFAKVDTTLEAKNAGDTITVPQFAYIGDAEDVAEGVEAGTVLLTATTTQAKVKKAMKAVELTDESVLSGYGDPVGEANNQLAKSIAAKVDADAMDALQTAQLKFDGSSAAISYSGIVDAVDIFEEEVNSPKVIFVHPKQVSKLRKDSEFLAADKLAESVIVTGAIGKICNCEVVPSKKVPENEGGTGYVCPIVKLNADTETEDESAAITVYMKRNVNLETERFSLSRKTAISVDEIYTVALSDASKVVLATFKK
jgi:N4-gp56 family major capsid protein